MAQWRRGADFYSSAWFLLAQRRCYFLCLDTKKVTKEKSRLQIILGLLFFSLPMFICSFFARPKNEPKKGAGTEQYLKLLFLIS
jgi:hypothetical protein